MDMETTVKRGAGRPPKNPEPMHRVVVYLTEEHRDVAALLSPTGNVSEGVRIALDKAVQLVPDLYEMEVSK